MLLDCLIIALELCHFLFYLFIIAFILVRQSLSLFLVSSIHKQNLWY